MRALGYCFNTLCRENTELFSSSYRHLSMRRSLTVSMCAFVPSTLESKFSTALVLKLCIRWELFYSKKKKGTKNVYYRLHSHIFKIKPLVLYGPLHMHGQPYTCQRHYKQRGIRGCETTSTS